MVDLFNNKRMSQKSDLPLLFSAPTVKPVGSFFCNLFGTNGFTRWSTNNK